MRIGKRTYLRRNNTMAKEQAKDFMKLLNVDTELQNRVKDAIGDKEFDEKDFFTSIIIPLAKEKGYDFTYEDVAEISNEVIEGELSDDEVLATGGIKTTPVISFLGPRITKQSIWGKGTRMA